MTVRPRYEWQRGRSKRWCAAGPAGARCPEEWARDVAATYLTLRVPGAGRHSGVVLIDPVRDPLSSVAWHEARRPRGLGGRLG